MDLITVVGKVMVPVGVASGVMNPIQVVAHPTMVVEMAEAAIQKAMHLNNK
ncbi:Uncharacterised protein [Serratia quinivorans]|nr:Uncharacterised protein [Serratia quinivorans]